MKLHHHQVMRKSEKDEDRWGYAPKWWKTHNTELKGTQVFSSQDEFCSGNLKPGSSGTCPKTILQSELDVFIF